VIDRGLQSTRNLQEFSKQAVYFVCRAKENRKYVELESKYTEKQDIGEAILLKDAQVQFYTGVPFHNKKGKIHYRQELVPNTFRLIILETKADKKTIWLITNNFELSALQIAQIYKKRWDIEVFFRFIKQELNFNHLIALNKNGIEVMLYMTLIVAMLLLMYKKVNKIGYKTAKRRMAMEIRNLAIALIVLHCGGYPDKLFIT
jgi:IS4 transposase